MVIKQHNWKTENCSLAHCKGLQIAILVGQSHFLKTTDVITRLNEVFLERKVSKRFSFAQVNCHYAEARLTNTVKSVSSTMSGQRWKSMLVTHWSSFQANHYV